MELLDRQPHIPFFIRKNSKTKISLPLVSSSRFLVSGSPVPVRVCGLLPNKIWDNNPVCFLFKVEVKPPITKAVGVWSNCLVFPTNHSPRPVFPYLWIHSVSVHFLPLRSLMFLSSTLLNNSVTWRLATGKSPKLLTAQ